MLKFYNYDIVCQEIPDEVTLAINITGCPIHCPGCHSTWLWEDCGDVLCSFGGDGGAAPKEASVEVSGEASAQNPEANAYFGGLEAIVEKYAPCITCVCFMGGDATPEEVAACSRRVRELWPSLKTGWYSGRQTLVAGVDAKDFNYLKLGPYIAALGGLRSPRTNQKLYKVETDGTLTPIQVYDPHKGPLGSE